jgi:GNAT superfamily N-acetyltransferase
MCIHRPAPAKVLAIVRLAQRMHAESAFRDLPLVVAKVAATVNRCLTQPDTHFGMVAELDGEVIGFLGGALGTYPFCNEILAHDLGFYVASESRRSTAAVRLLRAFFAWAKEKGAREVQLGVSSGVDVDRIGAFYERLGLRRMGGIYRGMPS